MDCRLLDCTLINFQDKVQATQHRLQGLFLPLHTYCLPLPASHSILGSNHMNKLRCTWTYCALPHLCAFAHVLLVEQSILLFVPETKAFPSLKSQSEVISFTKFSWTAFSPVTIAPPFHGILCTWFCEYLPYCHNFLLYFISGSLRAGIAINSSMFYPATTSVPDT